MTTMTDSGNYFEQAAVATDFALHTIATGKSIRNDKATVWQHTSDNIEAMPEIPNGNYRNNDEQIIFTGFRMDGDDTLMSAEERLQIISSKKNYRVSA